LYANNNGEGREKKLAAVDVHQVEKPWEEGQFSLAE
jgi:hypothetical protein